MMNSIWICADAAPSKAVKKSLRRRTSASSQARPCFLGVFTDDPATIGQWLPRPLTPFVPAPEVNSLKHIQAEDDLSEVICDSPATEGLFDFRHPRLQGIAVGVSVF
jgi:hypothetical protein